MDNMRLDIIRKELDRRYAEIEQVPDRTSPHLLLEPIYRFLHSMLIEPATRAFIIDLSRSGENFKATDKFIQIKKDFIKNLNAIITLLNASGFLNVEFKKELNDSNRINYSLAFEKHDDTEHPFDKFIENLLNIDKNFNAAIPELRKILGSVSSIFNLAKELGRPYDHNLYKEKFEKLSDAIIELDANLGLQVKYDGADSLNRILPYYLKSNYRYLSGLSGNDFGEYMEQAIHRAIIGGNETSPSIVNDCQNVYHAIDRFLSTSKSQNALIDRLITYCTWIKRDAFTKINGNKEARISKILEEFIFNNGYFPIVNFKTGKSFPDILIDPTGANVRWDNSILIELKQSIDSSYTPKKFETDIGQAQDYLMIVKSLKPDIADSVYLLIFYNGNKRLPNKSLLSVVIPDSVKVEFIYVGDKSPSKLTG